MSKIPIDSTGFGALTSRKPSSHAIGDKLRAVLFIELQHAACDHQGNEPPDRAAAAEYFSEVQPLSESFRASVLSLNSRIENIFHKHALP
jgi:hypothetical protein